MAFRSWGQQKPPPGSVLNPSHPRAPDQGCWLVNEGASLTLRDISARAGNAALTKNSGTLGWGISPYGQAFLCGGSSQFDFPVATIPTSAWANLGSSSIPNFTIVADIYMVSAASGSSATLLSHHTGTFGNQLYVFFDSNTLKLSFTYDATYARNYALPSNVWVRFALVKNGTNVKLYQNGVQQDSFSVGASISGDNTQAKKIFTPAEVGGLSRYLVYGRGLSAVDIWADFIDPYGFISAPNLRLFSMTSGTVIKTVSDAATGAQTVSLTGKPTDSDSAIGAQALDVELPLTDAAVGAVADSLKATDAVTDAAAGANAADILLKETDAATGTQAASASAHAGIADTAAGAIAQDILLKQGDSATGTQAASASAQEAISDAAAGTVGEKIDLPSADAALGTQTEGLTGKISDSEAAAGADLGAVKLGVGDTGTGYDASSAAPVVFLVLAGYDLSIPESPLERFVPNELFDIQITEELFTKLVS